MPFQSWVEAVNINTADGAAVANTTAETIIFPTSVIPANYFSFVGRSIRMQAYGKLSNTASATMTFALRMGGVSGVLLATTEAINPGSAVTNINWYIDALIQCRTTGSSGTLFAMGNVSFSLTASTDFNQVFGVSGFDAPAASAAIDLSTDQQFALTADWSAASASNTLTGHLFMLESLN